MQVDEKADPESISDSTDHLARLGEFLKLVDQVPTADLYEVVQKAAVAGAYKHSANAVLTALGAQLLNVNLGANAVYGETPSEVSPLMFPVGFRSPDDAAVLGREGYLFLTGGSNDVIGQYAFDHATASAVVDGWVRLFDRRAEFCETKGIKLLHIVVPEKISLLGSFFPTAMAGPTPALALLEAARRGGGGADSYVSALSILSEGDVQANCRRTDSHLSPRGSFELFRALAYRGLGVEIPDLDFDVVRTRSGDLAFRMTGFLIAEQLLEADPTTMDGSLTAAEKKVESIPESGGHLGRGQVWVNPEAPIKAKVIVFGNSFFSFVEFGQPALSWWFARWFTEFHFIWTNEFDYAYVEAQGADLVIWQGVERFLPIHSAT